MQKKSDAWLEKKLQEHQAEVQAKSEEFVKRNPQFRNTEFTHAQFGMAFALAFEDVVQSWPGGTPEQFLQEMEEKIVERLKELIRPH